MNTDLSPAVDFLYQVETARREGRRAVCELLSVDSASTIAGILVESEPTIGALDTSLLEEVAKTVEDHKIKQNITDWPFEHFWDNPNEPRHSKLLRYFIDPAAEHSCGSFLLGKLFDGLKGSFPPDHRFQAEHCRVSQPDFIDLLIEMDSGDGKYAVIIENKINWAKDQWKQLQRYVESVKKRRFDAKQIYVFYLPLTSNKDPNRDDVGAITRELGVNYRKITFDTDILNWLETVLITDRDPEWPSAMREGMCENLSHYRNLIRYLVNAQKELNMNREILKQLEQAEKKTQLPTWSQVESLHKSALELKQCLQSVLRGKMLLRIQILLKQKRKKVDVRFYLGDGTVVNQTLDSPYDDRFDRECNLGIRVSDTVVVCFGGYPEKLPTQIFWTGYMRSGRSDEQETHKDVIMKEAKRRLTNVLATNLPWYVWGWNAEINYDNCVDESTADRIADTLLDMCDSLIAQIRVLDSSS